MTPVVSDRGNGTATTQLANDGRTWYQQVDYYTALLEGTAATVPSYTSVVEELALSTLLGEGPPRGESTSVPEPGTTCLLLVGLAGLGFVRRCRS